MRMSFKEFLKLDKETQKALGNMSEELSPELKKKKSIELEKLLHHQQEVDDKVKKLQSEIGDDALTLTKIYVESKTSPTPVKDEVKERQSIFPEQNVSQKNISLGYGDGYVLENKHHFADTPFDTTTKWTAPSPMRKRGWQDK